MNDKVKLAIAVTAGALAWGAMIYNANASVFHDHPDGYERKKNGEEPYATHFSGAEIHCITEGYSWPGYLTSEKAAQLQTSEMILCIETEINERVTLAQVENEAIDTRLLEIENALKALMEERDRILNGG